MKKARKILLSLAGIIIIVILLTALGIYLLFSDSIRAVQSLHSIDHELYEMTYVGDYGVEDLIKQGGVSSDLELESFVGKFLSHGLISIPELNIRQGNFGCSTLAAPLANSNGYIFGRNFDWAKKGKTLIIKTYPKNGYASVSTSCLDFLGIELPEPHESKWKSKLPYIAAIYVTLDGINEKGLCIADLFAGDKEKTAQERGKMAVTTTVAIRLLLDKAATTDEAIQMLSEWDMHSSINWAHHLAISDATGHSVVVEYVDNQMVVTETPAVTNHYLSPMRPNVGIGQTWTRRDTLCARLDRYPSMSPAQMKQLMEDVSFCDYTGWTVIFNTSDCSATYYYRTDYTHPLRVELKNRNYIEKGKERTSI